MDLEPTVPSATTTTRLDVRAIAPRDRHGTIFATFNDLEIGAALEIVNDHDPKPLYYQFKAELQDSFSWIYAENGPDVWRVTVRKLAQPRSAGVCCGACGGA